jgi:hypothetical protein
MKRWTTRRVMHNAASGAVTDIFCLQVKIGGGWVSVATVTPTTDGRYLAASPFGTRLHYPSGTGAKAHRDPEQAKREALDIIEALAEWSVPW